ncbi:glycoside hydrolase family 43 protein [Geofilum sp. OHC36d9]|uniref:glycoside hydrolase family 43 protein n=1 Tax=Geofilum sp. OHC36d9 TaxID=3458413 RepID=UPI0040335AEF
MFTTVTIENPVLPGFYPDPSVCKGADGYYLVNSTFGYYPGIPVFYSPDLVQWQQVGNVLNRPGQLKLDGLDVSHDGVYAPSIDYHDGLYYVACTEVRGRGNFIVTAGNPAGSWSDPHWIPVSGIDPSLFFDDNDRLFMVFNSEPPNNESLYSGHRTIRMVEIDKNTLTLLGNEKILINGGVDLTQKPAWIEGPHLYKKDGYYYLCAAEGGTGVDHRQVIFRSNKVDGPFVPWEKNPILTQRHLDAGRKNPVTSTGHADLIQDLQGNWWAVFLACRPYDGNHYNLGRETFMAPVEWEDGWPLINPNADEVQLHYQFTAALPQSEDINNRNGLMAMRDEFTNTTLDLYWLMIRTPYEQWFDIDTIDGGRLLLQLRPYSFLTDGNPSFIGRRQQHLKSSASVSMSFTPKSSDEKAGLMVFQNTGNFYFLCQSLDNDVNVIQLYSSTKEGGLKLLDTTPMPKQHNSLFLKIASDRDVYRCYYSNNDSVWNQIGQNLDARLLSTQTAGGFTGCLYGMFATTINDRISSTQAQYNWFEYLGND